MYVIGTAGHVDHGKSTLVRALTGIDPDRLQEEKRRGLTIDLGFTWFVTPRGREVSVVDVPGHERFIKNMLAGVASIDLALVVVAADESIMPQTKEHLAILDLLGVQRGLIVITKCDLVDEDTLQLVQLEMDEVLKGTTLEESPTLAVSAITGYGLEDLIATIDKALDTTDQRPDLNRPRLAIDRSFSVAGFGVVVTGTLIDGTMKIGQEVELVPSGIRSRIRGLQTHLHMRDRAFPGNRVAVNLSGLSVNEIGRGQVLTIPGWLRPTKAVDARLAVLTSTPKALRHNLPVTLHAHATETTATLRLLDLEDLEPGKDAWVQFRLAKPMALVVGDHFVIRSSDATLGGGVIADPYAARHRRYHSPTLDRLASLTKGSPTARLFHVLEAREPATVAVLAQRMNLSIPETLALFRAAVEENTIVPLSNDEFDSGTIAYTAVSWSRISDRARQILAIFHRDRPLRRGMPREELRTRLRIAGTIGSKIMQRLTQTGVVMEEEGLVRSGDHHIILSKEQQELMDQFIQALEKNPFAPAPPLDESLLGLLMDNGMVVKVAHGIFFGEAPYNWMKDMIVTHMRSQGSITVAGLRDLLGTSRKYALALLTHLDDIHLTRRVGDERTLIHR